MTDWLTGEAFWWLFALVWVVAGIGTLVVIPVIVIRMPTDYFMPTWQGADWSEQHPAARMALRAGRNLLGGALVLLGVALSFPLVPGQGILTILIGLSLLDFPGKRTFELRLVRQRPVRKAIDWIRVRAGRPPLQLPERGPS
jgi:hypothetical protein